ncbi:MAG: TolB family protein [Actinomycetota bacterium]
MRRAWTIIITLAMCVGVSVAGSPAGARTAAANGKIAFTSHDAEADANICLTINPDGTGQHQIGTGDVGCRNWSPDSSKILASVNPEGNARPATANPDGSDFTILDAYPNLDQTLSCGFWSPDARRFLCKSAEDGNPSDDGLYTLRSSDGGDLTRVTVTPDGFEDDALGYSPDGSRILYSRNDLSSELENLFAVNPDGTGLVQLNPPGLQLGAADCCNPAASWSPDGAQVAFAAFWKPNIGHARRTALFVVNADGTGIRRVTPFGQGARNGAAWSPDGELIAFDTPLIRGENPQIWVVHPDGTGLRELTQPTHGDNSFNPVWSPDSARLVFQSFHPEINGGQNDVWIVNDDGTGLFQLSNTPEPLEEGDLSWGSAPPS